MRHLCCMSCFYEKDSKHSDTYDNQLVFSFEMVSYLSHILNKFMILLIGLDYWMSMTSVNQWPLWTKKEVIFLTAIPPRPITPLRSFPFAFIFSFFFTSRRSCQLPNQVNSMFQTVDDFLPLFRQKQRNLVAIKDPMHGLRASRRVFREHQLTHDNDIDMVGVLTLDINPKNE